jgi:hypothetical protein
MNLKRFHRVNYGTKEGEQGFNYIRHLERRFLKGCMPGTDQRGICCGVLSRSAKMTGKGVWRCGQTCG